MSGQNSGTSPRGPIEISVDGELFRISQRRGAEGSVGYDFSWLNGPAGGTYGFSVGGVIVGDASADEAIEASTFSRDQLIAQVQGFLRSFYEEGGIGQTDVPDHRPAQR